MGKRANFAYTTAVEALRRNCNAMEDSFVVPAGAGVTGAIRLLSQMLGLYMAPATLANLKAARIDTDAMLQKTREKHVVLTSYAEHHSNDISWHHASIASVERVPLDPVHFLPDYQYLETRLRHHCEHFRFVFLLLPTPRTTF